MAYETGAAATVDALLQKISTFALGLGYTINRDTAVTNGRELCIYHADAGYYNFLSDNTIDEWTSIKNNPKPHIYMWGSTAYDSGNDIDAQTGTSGGNTTNGLSPDFHKYHLFGTTSYIHCVIEIQPGLFAHLGCGILEKAWDFADGSYIYGTYWDHSTGEISDPSDLDHQTMFDSAGVAAAATKKASTYIRCDLEGISPRWFLCRYSTVDRVFGWGFRSDYTNDAYGLTKGAQRNNCPNAINGLSPLMPMVVAVSTTDNKRYLVGKPLDVRFVNIELTTPSDTITYGTDDWIIFPLKKKQLNTVVWPEFSSEQIGIAYRKV